MDNELFPVQKHEEYQYLSALYKIIIQGTRKPNRTANETYGIFGNTMKFTLSEPSESGYKRILPLLTTKNMARTVDAMFAELIFFIQGKTDTKLLDQQGVKIWNQNTSRAYLDSVGLKHYEEGDAGEIYGFQWRHFGAEYRGCQADYTGQGLDQLQNVISELKKNPYSRRLIITAWNPLKLRNMCLPPCHLMYQFNVEPAPNSNEPKYLDCLIYQRSADMPLGVPFNIASYATLTHIVAYLTDLVPKTLTYVTGDTHIYADQIHLVPSQLFREPYPFPELEFAFGEKKPQNIDEFTKEMLQIKNYKHHYIINYPFSV